MNNCKRKQGQHYLLNYVNSEDQRVLGVRFRSVQFTEARNNEEQSSNPFILKTRYVLPNEPLHSPFPLRLPTLFHKAEALFLFVDPRLR